MEWSGFKSKSSPLQSNEITAVASGAPLQTLEVGANVRTLSFTSGPYLQTNRGILKLRSYPPLVSLPQIESVTNLFVKEHWVTRDLENFIWLPFEYRPACSAFKNNILVLGHLSGQVTFIKFSLLFF